MFSGYLGAMLVVNRTVEVFHMVHNHMETPDAMDVFYRYMEYNDTLQYSILIETGVDSDSCTALVEILRVNKSLVKLHLRMRRRSLDNHPWP